MTSKSSKLTTLSTKDLQACFLATFGKPTPSRNRPWLIKRLSSAPTVQAQAPTPVPKAPAMQSAATAATAATATTPENAPAATDPAPVAPEAVATPTVGSEIRRTWRGQELVVTVQSDGFQLNGTVYRSLSAAATALCGGNRNGLVFFGLKPRPVAAARIAS